jgi:MSHA biogenesis protein MshJ
MKFKLKAPAGPDVARLLGWWAVRPWREKLLIIGGTVVAILAVGDAVYTAPLDKQLKRSQAQLASTQKNFEQLAAKRSDGAEQARTLREQEAYWRERLATANTQWEHTRNRAAEASRLPEMLRAVVGTVGNARLLALELRDDSGSVPSGSTPAVAALPVGTSATTAAGTPPRLYRLPIVLRASGPWSELQQLLKEIERHAEQLHWVSVQLDSSAWPEIELTLKAQVLSLEPRWGSGS